MNDHVNQLINNLHNLEFMKAQMSYETERDVMRYSIVESIIDMLFALLKEEEEYETKREGRDL